MSLEVSPLLAYDTDEHAGRGQGPARPGRRAEPLHQDPGHAAKGCPAIEEAIFAGVPINVTLLFSREQYLAAAEAYLRGIERRVEAGLDPNVGSVASLFVSRWDAAVAGEVPEPLKNRLGIAMAKRTYAAARTAALLAPLASASTTSARVRSACSGPAPGRRIPQAVGRALHQGPRGAVHREHDAGKDPHCAGRPHRARARSWPPTAATASR